MKNLSFRQAITTALLASSALVVSPALAADYIVSTPTSVTNGASGNVLNGNDTLSVQPGASIATSGNTTNAVSLSGIINTVNNSGALSTTGIGSYGIGIYGALNTINNSGTINTLAAGSFGIFSGGAGNTINNSGSINTSGTSSTGVVITAIENTINNSGTIFTQGSGADGISSTSNGATINNSGKIVSLESASLNFSASGDNEFNLSAPSFIGGIMRFGSGNMVNITTGRSHSVLWDFSNGSSPIPAMAFSGPVPWAWDATTQKFATIDPTALSAAGDMLADITGLLSDVTGSNPGVNDNNWWLNGYGNFSGYGAQGVFNDYNALNGGIATGASFVLNDNFSLGAMAGYMASNLTVNSKWMTSQTITGNGIVGGIYGSARADNMFVDFAVYAGGRTNSSSRLVNDNLALLGVDYANANYNSWFISPQVRVGLDIPTNGDWTMTPSATARFSSEWIAGYSETGSNANAIIPQRQVQIFDGNLEIAATRKLENGSLTLKGGAQYRQQLGAATQNVTLLGQTLAVPLDNAGAVTGYAGIDAEFDLSDTSAINLSAKGAIGQNNFKSISAQIGFNTKLL